MKKNTKINPSAWKEFALFVRRSREALSLSAEKAAELAEMGSRQNWLRFESLENPENITLMSLVKIAAVLEVRLNSLTRFFEDQESDSAEKDYMISVMYMGMNLKGVMRCLTRNMAEKMININAVTSRVVDIEPSISMSVNTIVWIWGSVRWRERLAMQLCYDLEQDIKNDIRKINDYDHMKEFKWDLNVVMTKELPGTRLLNSKGIKIQMVDEPGMLDEAVFAISECDYDIVDLYQGRRFNMMDSDYVISVSNTNEYMSGKNSNNVYFMLYCDDEEDIIVKKLRSKLHPDKFNVGLWRLRKGD